MRFQTKRVPEGGAIKDETGMTAEQYGAIMQTKLGSEYQRFADEVVAKIDPPEGGLVLEIGPGPGWVGIMLLKKRPDLRLIGLDASDDMRRAAGKNAAREGVADRAEYRVGMAESLEGVTDHGVDLVISRDSLHHWDDPRQAFASILRVLKPKGAVFLRDERRDLSLGAWIFTRIFGPLMTGKMSKYWFSSIRAAYTPEELRAILPPANARTWHVTGGFLDLTLSLEASGAPRTAPPV